MDLPVIGHEPLQDCLQNLRDQEPLVRAALARQRPSLGPVSAVLATYNRCPFDPDGPQAADNPLTWALDSLLAQSPSVLAEIVVANDGSSDHTSTVLSRYADRHGVRVERPEWHLGSAAARNRAAQAARSSWLLYCDDDCVMPALWAAGALHLMNEVLAADPHAAALMLPFYYRDLAPNGTVSMDEVGRLDMSRARFSTGFHLWPTTHLPEPPLCCAGLVPAFQVELVGGQLLLERAALERIGGWADQSTWTTSYTDQAVLSADLTAAGHSLYFTPDPRLGSAHLKWGAVGRYMRPSHPDRIPAVDRSLIDLIELSQVPRVATGCRTTPDEFLVEEIGSFFEFFALRDRAGALAWAVRTYEEFVDRSIVYTRVASVPSRRSERRNLWRKAIYRGTQAASRSKPSVWDIAVEAVTQLSEAPITAH
ncbi:MAG: hypothetical protein QG608_3321 [Actinomycetota bacterium]|nr:hypothetical protein [Actinomycetota bacterium]